MAISFSPRKMIGAALVLGAFIVLIGLGNWQINRLHWKEGLLARIEAGMSGPAVALPGHIDDLAAWEYRHVRLSGRFDHQRELLLHAIGPNGQVGYHVYTPFLRTDQPPVIVNRGFVPAALKDARSRTDGQVTGQRDVRGYVRLSRPQLNFVPDNDAAKGEWFFADVPAMAAAMNLQDVYPVFVELAANGTSFSAPSKWPAGGVTRVHLSNKHLGYAITWYGLAASLAGVVGVYLWRRRKQE